MATARGNPARSTTTQPRVVVVTRPTEFEWLLKRHATPQAAAFFLERRRHSLEVVRARHDAFQATLNEVLQAVPREWRRTRVARADLDRFLFGPEDLVVALGQDGLVANVAKYLEGQPVIGINPDPERYEGVLAPNPPVAAPDLIRNAGAHKGNYQNRTMVEARLDDGQQLPALNEIFVGHRTHQSAKYEIHWEGRTERHSSSGLIVATGTGATGWARSIALSRRCQLRLPDPPDRRLVFFVREAWPSVSTGADCVEGILEADAALHITSRMEEDGVIFGDGIETDRIEFGWGRRLELRLSERVLKLMCA